MPAYKNGYNVACPVCQTLRYRSRSEIKRGIRCCCIPQLLLRGIRMRSSKF